MDRSGKKSRLSIAAAMTLAATMSFAGAAPAAQSAQVTDVPSTLKLTYKAGSFRAKVGSTQPLCSGTTAGLERTVELRLKKNNKLIRKRKTNTSGVAKFPMSRRAVKSKTFYSKVRPLVAADYGNTYNCLSRRSNRVKR